MIRVEDLIEHNAKWAAEDFEFAGLPTAPDKKLAIVVCMDARIDVFAVLGLGIGDAHVIRNAGGIVTEDVERSIAISQRFLETNAVVVIQHTRCGMSSFTDLEFNDQLADETGQRPGWTGCFTDIDRSVRESVERVRQSPFIPKRDQVWGFEYDVETGKLRKISGPAPVAS